MNNTDFSNLWTQTINIYSEENNNQLFINEVVKPTNFFDLIDSKLIILVNKKSDIKLLEQCKERLENIFNELTNVQIEIIFIDKEEKNKYQSTNEAIVEDNQTIDSNINFDNYVISDFNKNAYRLANQIIENSSSPYNPIFIYSKTGLGKTHLLIAMVNEFIKKHNDKKIKYIESSTLISEIFNCFEEKNNSRLIEDLKKKYSNYDVLIIDDVQYFANKSKTNEILFTIFNNLKNNKKTIVMTSDRTPTELNGFEDRMISRFSSGISCKIDEPDENTLKTIISKKLIASNVYLTEDAIDMVANYCDKDIRNVIGLLNKIVFLLGDKNGLINQNEIKAILEVDNQLFGYNKKNPFAHPSKIIENVAKVYNVKVADIVSNSRKKNVATARHVAMFIMRENYKLQLKDIGSFLGNRDHTTVLSGVEKIKGLITKDKDFSKLVNSIIKKIN